MLVPARVRPLAAGCATRLYRSALCFEMPLNMAWLEDTIKANLGSVEGATEEEKR
eukprot:COSAG01_NODE_50028_length_367_cov_0.705224_1_plen_54_part_01